MDPHPGLISGVLLAVRAIPVVVGWDAVWRRGGRLIGRPPRRQLNRSVTGVVAVRLLDLLLIVLAVVLDPGLSWQDLGVRDWHVDTDAQLLCLLPFTVVLGAVLGLGLRRVHPAAAQRAPRFFNYVWMDRLPATPALVLAVAVVVPIEEELFYRGVLLGFAIHLLGVDAGFAIAFVSVFFAIGHAYQGPKGVARALVLGVLLAGQYLASGSIWIPIITHAVLNAVAIVLRRIRMRELRAAGDRPLPLWPADSVTVDLLAAYASEHVGVPDIGPIRRCVKTAIVVDLLRWGVVQLDHAGFHRRLSTSGSPQADIQLRNLDGKPLSRFGESRITDPVIDILAREMVEAGRLDYAPWQLDQVRYRPRDPQRVNLMVDSVRALSAGAAVRTDESGAVFSFLALEAGLVPVGDPAGRTVPVETVRLNLLAGSGRYRPLLEITADQAPGRARRGTARHDVRS